jgi:hypothetical protein
MKITFVKKIKADGNACRKCAEVQSRLENEGYIEKINETVIADERDMDSEGMQLAKEYNVSQAPFFIVEEEGREAEIYTVYFKFINEVLKGSSSEVDTAKDILEANDLDFL